MMHRQDLSHFRKGPGLLVQQMGSETLLYDERTHKAFCLNALAAQVWDLLDRSMTLAQIAASATCALQNPVTEDMVMFAVNELQRDGLICDGNTSLPATVSSRRVLLQRFSAGTVMMLPVVAMVMAPTAAQAYNGCADCAFSPGPGSNEDKARTIQETTTSQQKLAPQHSDYEPVFVP